MAIDTLGYVKALKEAGVPAVQAEAHAEALRDKIVPELATKQDLKELGAELRTEMWRMSLAVVLGTTTLVTAVHKLLQ